jgi:hypothetical protein
VQEDSLSLHGLLVLNLSSHAIIVELMREGAANVETGEVSMYKLIT